MSGGLHYTAPGVMHLHLMARGHRLQEVWILFFNNYNVVSKQRVATLKARGTAEAYLHSLENWLKFHFIYFLTNDTKGEINGKKGEKMDFAIGFFNILVWFNE